MIGLIDIGGKLPNLALMKISAFYKSMGEKVEFGRGIRYEKMYASCLYTWERDTAQWLKDRYGDAIEIGGGGWDKKKKLLPEIDCMKPDYELYTAEIISKRLSAGIKTAARRYKKAEQIANMGIGFTSRGCVRDCEFCAVPVMEGCLHQDSDIKDIINPRSNIITLYDNNLTADPQCIEKLHEIRDRGLIVNISQGVDVRLMTDEKAKALSEVKHLSSLHYSWDLMRYEKPVLAGIEVLSHYVKKYRHMCYILCGFNTTPEEDMYRVRKLVDIGVRPYVMKYNKREDDIRLNHFARWINGFFYKSCDFDEYKPWKSARYKSTQYLIGVSV